MVTTRTRSPYFSPNSAMAPCRLASSIGMTSACIVELAGQHFVDLLLDVGEDRAGHGGRGAEVEAEAAREFSEPALGGRGAEGVAQRLVGEVGGAVGAGDGAAAPDVDGGVGGGADGDLADLDGAPLCTDTPRDRLLDVADLDDGPAVQLDAALVGELAAALGVEGGAVEDHLDVVTLGGGREGTPLTRRPTTVVSPSVLV